MAQSRFGEEQCTPYTNQIADRTATCAGEVSIEAGGEVAASRLYVQDATGGTLTEITCDGDAHLFVDNVKINVAKFASLCQWDVMCKVAGGVWNSETSRCTPGVTQAGCEAGGGTWDAGTSTCTAASNYNCFVGGFCSQIALDRPPVQNNYPNAYDGHTQGTEPALSAGCRERAVMPGSPNPFNPTVWELGHAASEAFCDGEDQNFGNCDNFPLVFLCQ